MTRRRQIRQAGLIVPMPELGGATTIDTEGPSQSVRIKRRIIQVSGNRPLEDFRRAGFRVKQASPTTFQIARLGPGRTPGRRSDSTLKRLATFRGYVEQGKPVNTDTARLVIRDLGKADSSGTQARRLLTTYKHESAPRRPMREK